MTLDHKNASVDLEKLAEPGRPPGAIQGVAEVIRIAAAIARSSGVAGDESRVLSTLGEGARSAGAADEAAYWVDKGKSDDWKRRTPTELAQIARQVAKLTSRASVHNHVDASVSRLLSSSADAACQLVADANDPPVKTEGSLTAASFAQNDPLVVNRAVGPWVWSHDETMHFDAAAGLWNTPLGHGHPEPLAGFLAQAACVANINPFFQTSQILHRVSAQILRLCNLEGGKVFFCSSGSEAIETALRLGLALKGPGSAVWALPNAFHGSTMGAAMISSFTSLWREFERVEKFVKHADPKDWNEPGIGILEPIRLGGGLLRVGETEPLYNFKSQGGVIIADEIACGLGRTYWPSACSALGVPFDILVFGKGLANGLVPMSCVVVSEEVAFNLRDKETDFGHTHSNHLAGVGAAEATLRSLEQLENSVFSRNLETSMKEICLSTSLSFRQEGATAILQLGASTKKKSVERACRRAGLLCHLPTVTDTLDRIVVAPPLNCTEQDLEEMTSRFVKMAKLMNPEP